MHELAVVALLLVLDTASLEIRVSGSAGNLGGTLTLPGRGRAPFSAVVTLTGFPGVNHHFQRDPIGAREGYDRLPTQELAPEVLAALCSWLRASLR